jgi:hypothetical protein
MAWARTAAGSSMMPSTAEANVQARFMVNLFRLCGVDSRNYALAAGSATAARGEPPVASNEQREGLRSSTPTDVRDPCAARGTDSEDRGLAIHSAVALSSLPSQGEVLPFYGGFSRQWPYRLMTPPDARTGGRDCATLGMMECSDLLCVSASTLDGHVLQQRRGPFPEAS